MSLTRRRFSKEFKAKVVLESLKERQSHEVLAKKYELLPGQITTWKAIALKNFGNVLTKEKLDKLVPAVQIPYMVIPSITLDTLFKLVLVDKL